LRELSEKGIYEHVLYGLRWRVKKGTLQDVTEVNPF